MRELNYRTRQKSTLLELGDTWLLTAKSTLKGQGSRNREVINNKGGDLLKLVPKGLSVMVVQRERDIFIPSWRFQKLFFSNF